MLLSLHSHLFHLFPILQTQTAQCLQSLLHAIQIEYYMASECVVWEGECSSEMYFIIHGVLQVLKFDLVADPEGVFIPL